LSKNDRKWLFWTISGFLASFLEAAGGISRMFAGGLFMVWRSGGPIDWSGIEKPEGHWRL